MEFPEGKYRLRNDVVIDITHRHHGWGLSCEAKIEELGDTKPQWHTWVILDRTGHYKGDRAQLMIWSLKEDPVCEHYQGKPLPQPHSAYDILEKL